jgi:fructose-1,6-bisphosphatase/inositol monophosphatase family enzyme
MEDTPPSNTPLEDLQKFRTAAEEIAREARTLIRSRLSRGFVHKLKPDGSVVTDIDTAVEDLVRSRIASAFPEHRIVGEEQGGDASGSDYVWVIDPIDGTHSLRHGVPLFGTLLALRIRGRSILGLIDLPLMDKTYVAVAGHGARCNEQEVHLDDVSSEDSIQHEIIGIGERKQFVEAGKVAVFDTLMRSHGSVRTYCDCFGHALAVEGCLGAMVDYNLRIWDVAATELIIREVGGMFVRVSVEPTGDLQDGRYDVVFGKPTVVKWILKVIGTKTDI